MRWHDCESLGCSRVGPIWCTVAGTVVRATPALREVGRSAPEFPVNAVLANALAAEQQDHVGEALAALEVLARRRTPEVFDEDDESPRSPAGPVRAQT